MFNEQNSYDHTNIHSFRFKNVTLNKDDLFEKRFYFLIIFNNQILTIDFPTLLVRLPSCYCSKLMYPTQCTCRIDQIINY